VSTPIDYARAYSIAAGQRDNLEHALRELLFALKIGADPAPATRLAERTLRDLGPPPIGAR
jgi:hypothetical protein